eukprot:5473050-Karenia_brevis.AAC.1
MDKELHRFPLVNKSGNRSIVCEEWCQPQEKQYKFCKLCKTDKELHWFPLVDKYRHRSIICEECQQPPCAACGVKIMDLPQAKATARRKYCAACHG